MAAMTMIIKFLPNRIIYQSSIAFAPLLPHTQRASEKGCVYIAGASARRAWRRYGKGRHPAGLNFGVIIFGPNTTVATEGGNLSITGTGQGSGTQDYGIDVEFALVQASGNGTLALNGTGGNGTVFKYKL